MKMCESSTIAATSFLACSLTPHFQFVQSITTTVVGTSCSYLMVAMLACQLFACISIAVQMIISAGCDIIGVEWHVAFDPKVA